MKINIIDNAPQPLTFKDLEYGKTFMVADSGLRVYLKIKDVYMTYDIKNEVDCLHDLTSSVDIGSKFYNAICLGNGDFHFIDYDIAVVEGDAELTWKRI